MSLIKKKMKSLVYAQMILFIHVKLLWLHIKALENDTDHFALLKFKEGITSDPYMILKSWNDSVPFCKWDGIACTRRSQRVTSLVLNDQSLSGSISPYIGNLTLLRFIDLQGNRLNGEIPQEIGQLFRLQRFLLYNNTIRGELPLSIANCSRIRMLWLTDNNFTGRIPMELGSFPRIQVLALGTNNLEGEIPSSLGNLSSLRVLSLPYNNLAGSIPEDLGRLRDLTYFFVAANKLSGVIPQSFFNISSLAFISVAKNQLHGHLPDNIGLNHPNLTDFLIGYNQFSDSIPKSICNASRLERVDMIQNNLSGQIPTDLGKLQGLSWLNLGTNNLGTNSTNDLDFFASLTNCSKLRAFSINSNNFEGTLPIFAANLSIQLNYFDIGNNRISGTIPAAFDNLVNLIGLSMGGNLLTGLVPSSVGKFQNLQVLKLDRNSFSGSIPSSLSNLTFLTELHLFNNKFDGSIPYSIGNCQMLNYIDLSQNNLKGEVPPQILFLSSLSKTLNLSNNLLTGKLPPEVGKLANLNALDISHNNLSGHIPSAIRDCKNLEYLYLQENSFEGAIPSSLASLRGLQSLDLSRNNLSGKIPTDLQDMSFLQYLNLSFNDLEGEVPIKGIFRNARAVSLLGNNKLCGVGGVPEHNLPICLSKTRQKGELSNAKMAVIITCAVVSFSFLIAFVHLYWTKRSKRKSPPSPSVMQNLIQVSYGDLYKATNGFSSNSLIGSGGFGSVYKGFLVQVERPVAVKVLNLEKKGAIKSFKAECNALRNIRHRNLVKILSYCSSIDYKRNEFKALIYEFMEEGSLEKWLHPNVSSGNNLRNLNFTQRLNVATDVASALYYLHELSEMTIIHCDLKPSNVLLNEDMVAHLSDFGLARLFSTGSDSSENQTSTMVIKGTVGYAAPEYGTASVASKEGDVYSFGILVLEMFTGRRPTDEMFKDGLNLHYFVKIALPTRVMHIIDPLLLVSDAEVAAIRDDSNGIVDEDETRNENWKWMTPEMQKCLLSLLEIGVNCSAESPKDRLNMTDVTKMLHLIKTDFSQQSAQRC